MQMKFLSTLACPNISNVLYRLILNKSLAPKPETCMRIPLFIAVLHVLINISHSHSWTSPMRYNIFAYLWIIWWTINMVYALIHHPLYHWSHTPTHIGEVVQVPGDLPLGTMYFSVTIYCRSLTNVNLHYPALVLKLNTTVLSMWCLNLVGYRIYSKNYIVQFTKLSWYVVINSLICTFLVIQFNIKEPNT